MTIKVLFFGLARDCVGRSEDRLELPDGACLDDVFAHYAAASPRLAELGPSLLLAANQRFAARHTPVEDGMEVAFLPPVSGGSGPWLRVTEEPAGHFFALTREPIDIAALRRRLSRGEDGAIVVFEGVARNNTKGRATLALEYECYEAMAIDVMAALGRLIVAAYPIGRLAMVHRLGRVEIGEASVVIIATAPHRRPAFDAALEAIDRLKKTVPIWKKEFFADGAVWVEGEWDSSLAGS